MGANDAIKIIQLILLRNTTHIQKIHLFLAFIGAFLTIYIIIKELYRIVQETPNYNIVQRFYRIVQNSIRNSILQDSTKILQSITI